MGQGWRIAQGSKLFADFVAPQDAWPVARMKALGAVIVGITNSAEFACKGLTDNLLFGTTRSPSTHDLGLDYAIEPAVRARLEATVETLRSDGYRVESGSSRLGPKRCARRR